MMRPASVCFLLASAVLFIAAPAFAQTKIESQIHRDLASKERVRVIIVSRPELGRPDGGRALMNAAGYFSDRLAGKALNVRAIGRFPAASAEVDAEAVALLQQDPNVRLVMRDIPMPPLLFESVGLIGAGTVHQENVVGTGWQVAVFDTGVQVDHPAFKGGGIVGEACFSTRESSVFKVTSLCPQEQDMSVVPGAAGGCPTNVSGCEHGTHVAGIVAGRGMVREPNRFTGVAPAAGVLAVQVFTMFEDPQTCGAEPRCVRSFTSDQLRAFDWLDKEHQEKNLKLAAVNMSLGGGYHRQPCDAQSPLTEFIERLRSRGVATVIAAGNDGFFDGVSEPGCISSAITVAASLKTGDGGLDTRYTNVSPQVDLVAPGTDILSSVTGSGYQALSGTSMAAPHVAGVFALLKQRFPDEKIEQLEQRLTNGAPTVVDPRTNTQLKKVEVAHAIRATVPTGVPTGAVNTVRTPGALLTSDNGMLILETRKSENELQSVLTRTCPDVTCTLKKIGERHYTLEVTPRGNVAPGSQKLLSDTAKVEEALKDVDVRVYDNRQSVPMTPNTKP